MTRLEKFSRRSTRTFHFAVILLLIPALSICAAATRAAAEDALIDGLDPLTSSTLHQALNYLDIRPSELGFDKLYAEDDTFRLGIVENILNNPLKLPAWQKQTVNDFQEIFSNRVELIGRLGEICDAPDTAPFDSGHWPGTGEAWSGVDMVPLLTRFVQQVQNAELALNTSFAHFTSAEKDLLLMSAPVFWGDWDEPAEKLRKGKLHFEIGAAVDTTSELREDPILDLAVKMNRPAVTHAARVFISALAALTEGVAGLPPTEATVELEGVAGLLTAVHETPWGLLVIGGPSSNHYSAAALQKIAFIIEPGGDDTYRGRAASAVGELHRAFSAVVDFKGDDLYEARDYDFALGGAVLGVAALIDLAGDDIYRGADGSLGAGFFGAGFLYDGAGADHFDGRNFCQGSGAFGLGALISDCTTPSPPGPEPEEDRAFTAGMRKVPGTGATPIRFDDNDSYVCARQSQGFASTFGAGLLYDQKGSDTYRAGGRYLHRPLLPHDFQSLSQGYSIGFRPRAAGGVGILIDQEGNDFYNGEVYCQGVGYWYSLGFLYDGAGNDIYHATQYAQGAGVHLAIGSLWDVGGDDHYISKNGVTQGTAHDLSAGMLLDQGGNDYYTVSGGQAMSITNSTAIFIDEEGDDFYATFEESQGSSRWARGFCGTGIFLDLEGSDVYPRNALGENGAVWEQQTYGLGIDLDRNLELPGEVVPEIVLTAEDSLRDVAELFETASIWEVGNAREKVRRARKALIAKGMPAVDYATKEKLGSRDGLEFRAISELAEAYPDEFTARILPRLNDENEQVQRNVIGLLGDLHRTDARAPLEEMLADRKQNKHWTRIIYALGSIGDSHAAPRLRPFLTDANERRRITTTVALAALKDSTAVAALTNLLSDPLFTVRSAASSALRGFGVVALDPLAASLARGATQRALRLRTLGDITAALRDSTDEKSLLARSKGRDILMSELKRPKNETNPMSRVAAVESLLALGDEDTAGFVRLRMQDEFDPLVLRMYQKASERMD
ncbi:MAG: HEAT repeat domain-containing protein [Candidatus Eisenbacteria bacterium]|nr:HEAT repeat domain-containing protein [Candidatus Eisenbacteria bacterium]